MAPLARKWVAPLGCQSTETKEIRAEIEVERNLAVKKLAEQGFSQREISQRTDVPQKTVSRILSESKAQLAEMTHTKITTSEPSTARGC